jgi:branched-subunit amino acid transport protein
LEEIMSKSLVHAMSVAVAVGVAVLFERIWHQAILGWALAGGLQALSAQLIFVPKEKQTIVRFTAAILLAGIACAVIAYAARHSELI